MMLLTLEDQSSSGLSSAPEMTRVAARILTPCPVAWRLDRLTQFLAKGRMGLTAGTG
jgi:hypothetical protein